LLLLSLLILFGGDVMVSLLLLLVEVELAKGPDIMQQLLKYEGVVCVVILS
jgi:hypothetical protein